MLRRTSSSLVGNHPVKCIIIDAMKHGPAETACKLTGPLIHLRLFVPRLAKGFQKIQLMFQKSG